MKICRICNCEKEESEFYRDREKKDGLMSKCKTCNKKLVREWNERNPGRAREYGKNSHAKPGVKERRREWERSYRATSKGSAVKAKSRAATCDLLTDGYVRERIAHHSKISHRDIPQWLVNLKREQLLMHRILRDLKSELTNQKESANVN